MACNAVTRSSEVETASKYDGAPVCINPNAHYAKPCFNDIPKVLKEADCVGWFLMFNLHHLLKIYFIYSCTYPKAILLVNCVTVYLLSTIMLVEVLQLKEETPLLCDRVHRCRQHSTFVFSSILSPFYLRELIVLHCKKHAFQHESFFWPSLTSASYLFQP